MWRAAQATYVQHGNEMANILRQCVKEPLRSKMLARNGTHIQEKLWAGGVVQSKKLYETPAEAFKYAHGHSDK